MLTFAKRDITAPKKHASMWMDISKCYDPKYNGPFFAAWYRHNSTLGTSTDVTPKIAPGIRYYPHLRQDEQS